MRSTKEKCAINSSNPSANDLDFRKTFITYVMMYKGSGDQHHNMIAYQWITKIGVSFWNTVKSQNQYSLAKQIDFVSFIGRMLFILRVWDQEVILFQSMKEAVTDGMK